MLLYHYRLATIKKSNAICSQAGRKEEFHVLLVEISIVIVFLKINLAMLEKSSQENCYKIRENGK